MSRFSAVPESYKDRPPKFTPSSTSMSTVRDAPFVRFPPFPAPPPGVEIIPFKDFRPSGIQVAMHPDAEEPVVERDGLGIPTVELRVKHEVDAPGVGKKRKRKNKNVLNVEGGEVKKIMWWDHWAEGEDLRGTREKYDINLPRIDRLSRAADDFKAGRAWPPAGSRVPILWDQFRLYVGLLTNQPVFRKERNGKSTVPHPQALNPALADIGGNAEAMSDDDDDDDDDEREDNDDYVDDVLEARDAKLNAFLNDPELSLKVFFSSYMLEKGLVWAPRNLTNAPRLLHFFVSFLLRNSIFPDPSSMRAFQRALALVERAADELPKTDQIGKALPGLFSDACRMYWGDKSLGLSDNLSSFEETPDKNVVVDGDGDEQDKKRRKVIPAAETDTQKDERPEEKAFKEEVKNNNLDLIDATKDANIDANPWGSIDTTWASSGEGWSSSGWGADESGGAEGWQGVSEAAFGIPVEEVNAADWGVTIIPTLMELLGPTRFPLTHKPGVVEWSLRRVRAVLPPLPPASSPGEVFEDAAGIEVELGRRFGRVVLEPWLGWDPNKEPFVQAPHILPSSRGPVVRRGLEDGGHHNGQHGEGKTAKAHDLLKDEIVLLVPADVVKNGTLVVGMGLGATWVQIVRQPRESREGAEDTNEKNGGEANGEKKKKKKKKGKSKGGDGSGMPEGGYWYMEQLMLIYVGFFTQPMDVE